MKQRQFSKLKLMPHQVEALTRAQGRSGFAYLMEQGTGKTLVMIEEALRLYAAGEIEGVLVLAPNGVHQNWVLNEIPLSVPEDIPMIAAYYATNPTRKERKAFEELLRPRAIGEVPPLRFLTMSYDSLVVDRGFKFAEAFVLACKAMIIADESHYIKNSDARRTRRAMNIRRQCPVRRIATGTAIANSPVDAFSQFEFLDEDLLGETSITAFRARYCELLPHNHGVMRHIEQRMERTLGRQLSEREKAVRLPQLVAKDAQGRPLYRNLEELNRRIAVHAYRVLKEDCLELPPKTYETLFFHLTPAQRIVYDRMEKELRYILEDGRLLTASKLVALGKLRQITSGFMMMRDGTTVYLEDNPRVELLQEHIEQEERAGIVWSQHHEEQRSVARVLTELGKTVETINGEVPLKRRREIMHEFQAGNLQWISAHPATLGSGFTLTAGTVNYYYSNGFSMVERLQSEDRTHRKGTNDTVVYRDLVAIDTRDDDVVWALQHKIDIASSIQGDSRGNYRFRTEERKEEA